MKLQRDETLSNFAFKVNPRRYNVGGCELGMKSLVSIAAALKVGP